MVQGSRQASKFGLPARMIDGRTDFCKAGAGNGVGAMVAVMTIVGVNVGVWGITTTGGWVGQGVAVGSPGSGVGFSKIDVAGVGVGVGSRLAPGKQVRLAGEDDRWTNRFL